MRVLLQITALDHVFRTIFLYPIIANLNVEHISVSDVLSKRNRYLALFDKINRLIALFVTTVENADVQRRTGYIQKKRNSEINRPHIIKHFSVHTYQLNETVRLWANLDIFCMLLRSALRQKRNCNIV